MSTIQGTFNTAVQAMLTQSQELSNISTNIANVNTTGYKEQDSHFQTILGEVSASNQDYFSVQGIDNRNVTKVGTIATTNRTLDLALNGQGFMVTNTDQNGTGTWEYTRDGSFVGQAVTLPTTGANGLPDQGTLLTTTNGDYVYGWAADANGNFTDTNDLSQLTPVVYSNDSVSPSKATTDIQLQANVAAGVTGRQSVGLPFVDAGGNTRTLTVGFTNAGGSNWTLDMSSMGTNNQPVTVTMDQSAVSFDTTGKVVTPADGLVTATINDPSGPQQITVDLSGVTQYGGDNNITVQNINQDGYISGSLNNTYFNSDGVLIGSYTNGQVKNLYQLPVATFASPDNLNAMSGNVFTQTAASGAVELNSVGSPVNSTQFVPGALETSNVDLADQFSKMIVTQRAYSSAAEVVKTADQMTQAARDLVQ